MDETSVSFEMFIILLSFIALGSESQIFVFKQCRSNTQMSGLFFLGGGGWGGGACAEAKIWRKKSQKSCIRHFARLNFLHLSLASILKYYPLLHMVKR